MEPQEQVFTFLRDLGIPFDLVRHAPVDTMEDCAALGLSAPHCKNLFPVSYTHLTLPTKA